MRICLLTLVLLASAIAPARADLSANWFRYSAISPDGSTIVFSSGGDLYRVDTAGGRAAPLTVHQAWDGMPIWSRDGKWLAFASDRHGNLDVFVMPAEGGEAQRLTWYSSDDEPNAFSADGKSILFSSSRTDDVKNSYFPRSTFTELYRIPVGGGTPEMVLTTPALNARLNGDGTQILYENRPGLENAFRKHHTSSVTRDLWRCDLKSGKHQAVTTYEGEDREPVWDGDSGMYFLSERAGDMNIFHQSFDTDAEATQLTHFEKHPVRYLSRSDDGLLAFSWHGDLYTLRPGEQPQLVNIQIHVDRQQPALEIEKLRKNITEFAVAPDGEEIAFVARGEVFVTAADFSTTRRITDTPEQERSVSFSPDGRKLLYAGERDGSWNVYMTELADADEDWFFASTKLTETAVAATDKEEFQPHFSPDGEEVAYLLERTILTVKNLKTGNVRTIMGAENNYSYADGDQWYDWSPDSKWFAVQFLSRGRYYGENTGLIPADGSTEPHDISNSGYGNYGAEWSKAGDAVIWTTDRYGQKNHGSWGGEVDVVAAYLTQEAWDHFELSKEERNIRKGRDDSKKKDDDKAKDKDEDEDEDEDKEAKPVPVEIDFDHIEDRTVRLTIHSSDLAGFALTHKGEVLLYLARFEKGYDLWAHDLVEESTKLISKLDAEHVSMEVVEDGKAVFILADGSLKKIELNRAPDKGVSEGETSAVATEPEMNLRPDEEMQYLFDHVWRQVEEKFYDPELHGVDWEFYRAQYQAKLPGISHYRDFAELLSEELGELNGSHTGSRYIGAPESVPTASLGIFFTRVPDGLRIDEVLARGPLGDAELGIEAGMVITAINGTALVDPVNANQLLAGKAGERVRLTFGSGKKAIEKVVIPTTLREESSLRYDRWVEQRRALVEKLSGGRLGYVHVQGMNDSSFRTAYSEILGRYFEAEAMIVDTRCNGGGWLHDDLIVLLSGKHYTDFKPRNQALKEQRFYGEPGRRWSKPSAVVINEANYSDAHAFPFAYQWLGIGPLIGMPVAGTATAVWWETLHNGEVFFGIPQVGMLNLDAGGTYLENAELEPDFLVPMSPEDAAAGRDPQLEKAVQVLLKTVSN